MVAATLLSILIGWGLGFPEPGQGQGQDGIRGARQNLRGSGAGSGPAAESFVTLC